MIDEKLAKVFIPLFSHSEMAFNRVARCRCSEKTSFSGSARFVEYCFVQCNKVQNPFQSNCCYMNQIRVV